ncbi:ShlB/FhaC/HecB family hemolysin secretion/activation protein [Trichocoleus sp. FACHB-262]|uniref:ShlB/FhaC/HecB family hemolysin secretion/activation protein n=1 Tax=Trichocoleus sp. FACHB-262 TaxID=2692869 RepID=UPI0016866557|nr:ShlB/FhaC/HecB family hemolysin secretion/activation protein [Trichocoleus sp. FACHB-262]MBD2121059.1 ShlB/FhaC/HecB family hemolysin secretion/activation protein [Trichocoleus sp. FACHB-262]
MMLLNRQRFQPDCRWNQLCCWAIGLSSVGLGWLLFPSVAKATDGATVPVIPNGVLINSDRSAPASIALELLTEPPKVIAQTVAPPPADLRQPLPPAVPTPIPPSQLPEVPPLKLPEDETPDSTSPSSEAEPTEATVKVTQFRFEGNTAFSDERLNQELEEAGFLEKPLTFTDLYRASNVITQFYIREGYLTTGAFVPEEQPPLTSDGAAPIIQVLEGRVSQIRVQGLRRLNSDYVRSRLALATGQPLHQPRLLEALQLLQLDPLIGRISAELAADVEPGTNILDITVQEADTLNSQAFANNGRSPSVGSSRRGMNITEANLLGLGDSIGVTYTNTQGSDAIDLSYTLPINPRNGTLSLNYGDAESYVVEEPFDVLDITSRSKYYQVTLRQPLVLKPQNEFALGLTAVHTNNETSLLGDPFALTPGANDQGETSVSALRFFQEYTHRSRHQAIALRSQFSVGLNALGSTINDQPPDSRFFSWRGQAQWVQLLGRPTTSLSVAPTLLVRGDIQLADRPLLSVEQFGLGGFGSVRGYRQDALLSDSGAFASAEVRLPILQIPEWQTAVQLIPFVDAGVGWNQGNRLNPDPDHLAAIGLGVQLLQGNNFSARLDWGIPLIRVDSSKRTWQESGLYFSVEFNPF